MGLNKVWEQTDLNLRPFVFIVSSDTWIKLHNWQEVIFGPDMIRSDTTSSLGVLRSGCSRRRSESAQRATLDLGSHEHNTYKIIMLIISNLTIRSHVLLIVCQLVYFFSVGSATKKLTNTKCWIHPLSWEWALLKILNKSLDLYFFKSLGKRVSIYI